MELAGYDMSRVKYNDVQTTVWLTDTSIKMPSLKWEEKHFLGWDTKDLSEILGGVGNFSYLDPEQIYTSISMNTVAINALAYTTLKYFNEAGKIVKLEVDYRYLEDLQEKGKQRISELKMKIYTEFGCTFNIGSGKQLSNAFMSVGLNTGKYVKSGYMKTSMDVIEKLYERTSEPVLKYLLEYKSLLKSVSSYVESLCRYSRKNGEWIRAHYFTK